MRAARIALVACGCALAGFGALTLAQSLSVIQLGWLCVWLAAMIAVHDGVLVPVAAFARSRLRRIGRRWPRGLTALVEAAFVVVGVLALFVVPEAWAKARGNPNPTILQGDYALRLVIAALLVAAIVFVAARVLIRRSRR